MCRPWYWPVSTHGECHVSTDIYCYKVPHLLTRPRTPLDVTRRSSGVPPGGLRGDWQRSWLLNWILTWERHFSSRPLVAGTRYQNIARSRYSQRTNAKKIYCRVFSEEACAQVSIRFLHKCIVWIEKFATERSYPCHLQRRLRLHTSRCDVARSSYPQMQMVPQPRCTEWVKW